MNKVAVVSGGSKGLGAAIVQDLLDHGYRVASFSRTATALVDQWRDRHGKNFHFETLDLRDAQGARGFVQRTEDALGGIDILINNAGMAHTSLLALTDDAAIDALVDLNLKGTFYLSRQVSRAMLARRWGRIINISSIVGLSGYRGLSVYGATKSGLDGFTRALARELGPRNITVNSVAPGYLSTEMTEVLDERQYRQIVSRTPLGRLGDPADVTGLIRFLCSDDARFITGQVLVVDGGITA